MYSTVEDIAPLPVEVVCWTASAEYATFLALRHWRSVTPQSSPRRGLLPLVLDDSVHGSHESQSGSLVARKVPLAALQPGFKGS